MGRHRTKDLDLPPRLYRRGSSYYYVDAAKKWHPLGQDKARALRLWADLECVPPFVTVGEVVRRFISDKMDKYAKSTRSRYADYAIAIEQQFPGLPANDLTRFAVARWRDGGKVKPGWFNGCLSLLRIAYRAGGEWGWTDQNEAEHVSFNTMGERGRYVSDAEFRAIRDIAPTWLQTAMDLSHLTTIRESDLLALRWSAVTDRIYVEQIKTRRGGEPGTGTRQAFEITPAVRAVLEGAKRRSVLGLFVVATDKGRPIGARRLQAAFAQCRDNAGVERDTRFHDIRGKGATDAADAGLDYQAMLGHTTKKMSDKYVKSRRTINAPSLKRRV